MGRSEQDLVRECRATDKLLHELRAHRAHLRQLLDEHERGRDRSAELGEVHRPERRHLQPVGRPRSR